MLFTLSNHMRLGMSDLVGVCVDLRQCLRTSKRQVDLKGSRPMRDETSSGAPKDDNKGVH